jgi:hypothetical protein
VTCPHDACGELMSAHKLPFHDEVCPEKVVPCPYECGVWFKRKSIPVHTPECPFRIVECSFRCVGCNLVTMAKDMDEHLKVTFTAALSRIIHHVSLTKYMQTGAPQHCVMILAKSQEQDREIAHASQQLAHLSNDSETKYAQAIAASEAIAASITLTNATAFKRFKENERACKDSINLFDELKSTINSSNSQIESLRSNVEELKRNVARAFGGK